jgi:predicted esterase
MPIHQWFDHYSLDDPSQREDLPVDGLRDTAAYLERLMEEEARGGVARDRVFLAGLSQGCAAAIYSLLTLPSAHDDDPPLAGFIGMSGYLPFARHVLDLLEIGPGSAPDEGEEEDVFERTDEREDPPRRVLNFLRENVGTSPLPVVDSCTAKARRPAVLQTPVLLGHGELDEKVACALGRQMADILTGLDMDVQLQIYPSLGHWYQVPEQLEHIAAFLTSRMIKTTSKASAVMLS